MMNNTVFDHLSPFVTEAEEARTEKNLGTEMLTLLAELDWARWELEFGFHG